MATSVSPGLNQTSADPTGVSPGLNLSPPLDQHDNEAYKQVLLEAGARALTGMVALPGVGTTNMNGGQLLGNSISAGGMNADGLCGLLQSNNYES